MEREIKFRAWDTINKRFVTKEDNEKVSINFESGFLVKHWSHILLQFTGLRDKNGKEIYEGDIIQFNTWAQKNVREVVKFDEGAFMPFFDPHYCDDEQGDHFESAEDSPFEVIGNIYENKDLL